MKPVQGVPVDFSAAHRMKAARYIGDNSARFGQVMKEFYKGPYRHTQRAAGALVDVAKRHPHLLLPHIKGLLVRLDLPGNYPAMTRNILRLLQLAPIPNRLQGRAVNSCMRIMEDPNELVAAKVFGMTVLANIATGHPELKNEVRMVIESQYPYGSGAYRSRARKVLKSLES